MDPRARTRWDFNWWSTNMALIALLSLSTQTPCSYPVPTGYINIISAQRQGHGGWQRRACSRLKPAPLPAREKLSNLLNHQTTLYRKTSHHKRPHASPKRTLPPLSPNPSLISSITTTRIATNSHNLFQTSSRSSEPSLLQQRSPFFGYLLPNTGCSTAVQTKTLLCLFTPAKSLWHTYLANSHTNTKHNSTAIMSKQFPLMSRLPADLYVQKRSICGPPQTG